MRGPGSKIIIRRPCDLTSAGETVSLICSSITDGPVTLLCARIKLALSDRRFAAHLVTGFPFPLEKSGNFFNGFLKIKFPIPCPPNISDSYMQHIFCAGRVLHRKNIIFKRYLSRSSLGRLRFNWLVSGFHRQLYINRPQLLFVALSIPEILVRTLWRSLSRFTSGKANYFVTVRIFPFFLSRCSSTVKPHFS